MTLAASRRSRTRKRLAALTVLLTAALGSTAQTPLRWESPQAGVRPASATTTMHRATTRPPALPLSPAFDVLRFETMAQQLVAAQKVPGMAMAIVHNGRVLSARGYGITDAQAAEPVDSHTVFRLASLSKGFAGTLAGMLVNEGTLRWDSRLSQYMPQFRLQDPYAAQNLTVADVLSHRVGLTNNAYDRELEAYVDYRTLTQKLANAPLKCTPGTCYAYQNIAFSLVGDIVFAATGSFYGEEVQRRIFKPLGMNDASVGLDGIQGSARWAKPHVRGGGGWRSVMPKPTYYQVAPAAGINASASDMAQWLIAQTGHRPDVLPEPLLATLHAPLVDTPSETRGSAWRRARVSSAGYGLGWRVYDYAGHRMVFHGGAVQGYRGLIAMLPERDLGIALMWNGESAVPSGMLPTIVDSALGITSEPWIDSQFDDPTWYANRATPQSAPGSTATQATAAPF